MGNCEEQLREIKQSFRLVMNGVTAASQREKGLNYHLNWGAQLPHLVEMASQYEKDYHLAVALWKENIRECKILASMLMPPMDMPEEVVDIWMEQMPTQEIAELTSMYLFQYLPFAERKALQWLSSDSQLTLLCGYNTLSRLIQSGKMDPTERQLNEMMDQAQTVMAGTDLVVKKAVLNCMNKIADKGEMYERMLEKAKLI